MMKTMAISKEQAEKISEITSSVYPQGNSWVFSEWVLETGTTRLSRGLTEQAAKQKLKTWRRERVEELLRANGEFPAFTLRVWKENPTWNGQGIWQWAMPHWYTTKEDAEKAMLKKTKNKPVQTYEIYEIKTCEIPGHFNVA